MAQKKKIEFGSNFLSRNPIYQYLPQCDRYLFALPTPRHKFNIIGAGIMGQEHIKMTILEGNAIVYGIYDPNSGSVELAKKTIQSLVPNFQVKIYQTLEEACFDPEVDGLILSTPNYTHLDIVRIAIKSTKHIFLEKPMATTIQDAYEILQISKNYSAVFQIGLQYRYKAMIVESLHEVLHRKVLGDIKLIQINEHRIPFLDKVNQWNKFSKYSGGTLVEKCCHYFDLFNLFAQSRPKRVFATGSMAVNFKNFDYNNESSDILDNALVSIEYENGIRAAFSLCMFSPQFYEDLVICGDRGRLKASESQNYLDTGDPNTILEITRGELGPSKISHPVYPKYLQDSGHSGASFFEHKYFIDNIEGRDTNVATPEEGFWSIVVGVAAEESVKSGEIIDIGKLLIKNNISF